MTNEQIIENNKLIAEFISAEIYHGGYDLYSTSELINVFEDIDGGDPDAKHFYHPLEMKFHSSWDWIMPVVEKIDNLELDGGTFSVDMYIDICCIYHYGKIEGYVLGTEGINRLEATYKTVVEFIKWYNNRG